MADQIRVNGNQLSWGSIILKVNEERYYGFTSISYGDKRERSYAYGMNRSQAPRGISKGKYTPEVVSLSGWKGSVQTLLQALAAAGNGTSYGDTVFQIVVQYIETDDTPVTVEIEDCRVTGITSSDEEGPDPLKEELEIMPMRIRRNGLVLFDDREDR